MKPELVASGEKDYVFRRWHGCIAFLILPENFV
jgi:hypothetical protein